MTSTRRNAHLARIRDEGDDFPEWLDGLLLGAGLRQLDQASDAQLRSWAGTLNRRDRKLERDPDYIAWCRRDAHLERVRSAGMTVRSLGAHRWSDVTDDRLAAAVAELNSGLH